LNYYVYYKVAPDRVAGLRPSVQRLFDKIEAELGVRGRWMRRRDDPTTYMEVYENVKDEQAFEALLAREAPALGPERRVERFVQA
jgi:quinol monooxygenase YgiN